MNTLYKNSCFLPFDLLQNKAEVTFKKDYFLVAIDLEMHRNYFLWGRLLFKQQLATRQLSSHQTLKSITSPEVILSNKNTTRLLECLKKDPPVGIRLTNPDREKRYAAVLIALCTSSNKDEGVSILYTKRSIHLSRHVRQVSFPGGLQDETDNDYIDCALRETEEEIGLPRSRIEILGTGCIIRPPNTAAIMPVIGIIRNLDLSELTLNPDEVEDAFTVPVSHLIASGTLKHTQFKSGFSSPVFLVKPFKIWGVTGFITNNFLHCLLPNNVYKQRVKYLRPYKIENTPLK